MQIAIPDQALIAGGFFASTRAAAILTNIPNNVNTVFTGGYASNSDRGGATYYRVNSEPAHLGKFQSADGAWWEINANQINPRQLGADYTGVADSSNIISNIIATWRLMYLPFKDDIYKIGDVEIISGTVILGCAQRCYITLLSNQGPVFTIKNGASAAFKLVDVVGGAGNAYAPRLEGFIIDGANAAVRGISGKCNQGTFRTLSIMRCLGGAAIGSSGDYISSSNFENCSFSSNTTGIRNLVDGKVTNCTIANNTADGVRMDAGANDTSFVNNKVEFNQSNNFLFNSNTNNSIVGGVIDRAFAAGIRAINASLTIGVLKMRRNGRDAVGSSSAHILIEGVLSNVVINGVQQEIGADDGGGGPTTPLYGITTTGVAPISSDNYRVIIGDSYLEGVTSGLNIVTTPNYLSCRNNQGLGVNDYVNNGYLQIINGDSFISSGNTGDLAPGSSANITFTLSSLTTNSRPNYMNIEIEGRSVSTGGSYYGTVPFAVTRGSGGSATSVLFAAIFQATANSIGIAGTDTIQLAVVSTSVDGSSVVISVKNNHPTSTINVTIKAK